MKKRFIKTPLVGVQVHGAKDVGTRTVNLLMGEHAGEYVRGDIMDANAVIQAFDELKGNVDNNHDSLEEIVDELHNLRDTTDQRFDTFQEKAEEETANRIQGDKTLDEKIDQKERESKERDNVLQQNIDTEKHERVNADTQLRNDLTAEVNRAKASENALSSDIQAEATKRENDDNTIKDNLNAEVTRATAKENEIKAEVDVINGDSTTEGSFRKAIADVVGAAPEAYDTLKEIADKLKDNDDLHTAINDAIATKATTVALNEEITRAKAAEAENKAEIAAEAARAKEVEGDNALAIQNEESRATTAEGAINEAVNTEVDRAKGQEAYLQNLINAKADTTALNEQVGALNTAIQAKQDAGSYIPFDETDKQYYKIDKSLKIESGEWYSTFTAGNVVSSGNNNASNFSLGTTQVSGHSNGGEYGLGIGSGLIMVDNINTLSLNGSGLCIERKSGDDRFNCLSINSTEIKLGDENNDSFTVKINSNGIKFPRRTRNEIPVANGQGFININDYALKSELPTKVSQLTNDSNFITAADVDLTPYATTEALTAVDQKVATKQDKIVPKSIDVTGIETASIEQLRTIVNNLVNALAASGLVSADVGIE